MPLRTAKIPIYLTLVSLCTTIMCIFFLVNRSAWDAHTRDAIGKMTEIEKLVIDLETGLRGYLLTGKIEFLDPYFAAKVVLSNRLSELHDFVSDNQPQQAVISRINVLIDSWFKNVAEPKIRFRRNAGESSQIPPEITQMLISKIGKKTVDKIRLETAFFKDQERLLLVERKRAKDLAVVSLTLSTVLVSISAIFVLVINRRKEVEWARSILKKHRELEQANLEVNAALQARSDFITIMSHEFRTPLTTIIGYGELITENTKENDFHMLASDMEAILDSSRYLLAMVEDILDYAQISHNEYSIDKKNINVDEFFKGISSTCKMVSQKYGNEFTFVNDLNLSQLFIDPIRIRQIIINIVNNANRFTENGKIKVSLSHQRNRFEILISDTGCGIDRNDQARIFEPFVQINRDDSLRGTGLGLTLCKKLAEAMGGNIRILSEKGRGSTFVISFPLELVTSHKNMAA
ncbi:CHASE3 domain-containing protein [Pseudobacteriovorax antillogorgiicola]|uniref:histidine kinase n=1 Tax=Pseudobacteriovorax antillogorgiicola TaxID=1513793 RepID=A0A1Y6BBQ3_9BACT|nr:CHASE3 domain-containing protein [Pseudobacteriovorax antillogorgiicola]TCS57367.1 signal transduction histidine kinase [Pseudobacteriovorax antillogorgiicola]SMF01943.1 Signal transduction histidine kinase [Pseudobacteriovorax antillogorgiicola]